MTVTFLTSLIFCWSYLSANVTVLSLTTAISKYQQKRKVLPCQQVLVHSIGYTVPQCYRDTEDMIQHQQLLVA